MEVQVEYLILESVIGLRGARGVEGVGLDDVGAGFEIGTVDAADDLRPGQDQHIVIAFQILPVPGETLTAIVGLDETMALHHGAHGAIEDEKAPRE